MAALTPSGPTRPFGGRRLLLGALAVGVLGAVGLGFGFALEPGRTLHAYLAAYAYVTSIAVGALVLLLIGYAANARWLSVVRRIVGTVALAVVPLALLFVPIALGAPSLYLWADPHAVHALEGEARHLVEHKLGYLNVPFFVARAAGYFAVWILAAVLLRVWSRRRDRAHVVPAADVAPLDPEAALGRERAFASAMLPLVGFALTFAAFDWLMSLEPTWYSTMYGVYYFAGGFLAAIATVSIGAYAARRTGAMPELTPHHFHALGRLLLAFTVFWAYIAYFQVFLISIADRPIEVTFYLNRLRGSWHVFVYVLAIGHFALPFLLLLPRALKLRPGYVAAIAAWILVVRYADVYWLVLPTGTPGGVAPHLVDLAALAAVGGLTTAFCAWVQRGVALVPEGDPFLPEGLGYASPT